MITVRCPQCSQARTVEDWFDKIQCACGYAGTALEAVTAQKVNCPGCHSVAVWSEFKNRSGSLVIGHTSFHLETMHCPFCDRVVLYSPPGRVPEWIWSSDFQEANPGIEVPPGGPFSWGRGVEVEPEKWREQVAAFDRSFERASHFLEHGRFVALEPPRHERQG